MFGNSLAGTVAVSGAAVMLNTGIQSAWTVFAGITLLTAAVVVKSIIPKKEF